MTDQGRAESTPDVTHSNGLPGHESPSAGPKVHERQELLEDRTLGPGFARLPESMALHDREQAPPAGHSLARPWTDGESQAIIVTNSLGEIVDANRDACELLRSRREFLLDKPLPLFVREKGRSAFYELLIHMRSGKGVVCGVPVKLCAPRGVMVETLLWSATATDYSGRLTAIHWLFRDVSAVTRTERALREDRDFANALLETAQAIILVLDETGQILRANDYFRQICHWDDAMLLGVSWDVFFPEEDRPLARDNLAQVMRMGGTENFTSSLIASDGQLRQVRWATKALIESSESPGIVLVVGHDITDLQEARLKAVQAEHLASLGRVMAGLVHESRNLLQRSHACLQRLSWRLHDRPEELDLVDRVQAAHRELGRLFEDVRTYAVPMRLDLAVWDLQEVWREALAQVQAVSPGRQSELVEHIESGNTLCWADRFRLLQVFRNIFENAFAACPAVVRIDVTCRDVQVGTPTLQLCIQDNGPGLTAEQLQRIFDLFYTTKSKGTGLGMKIAQRIVEAHGGKIQARNADSGGAEIRFTLRRGKTNG